MAVGTTAALLIGLGAAGAGVGASKLMGAKQSSMSSSPLPMPEAPKIDNAVSKGDAVARAKRTTATQSVYTSPLGVSGEANVARKTLLGQ